MTEIWPKQKKSRKVSTRDQTGDLLHVRQMWFTTPWKLHMKGKYINHFTCTFMCSTSKMHVQLQKLKNSNMLRICIRILCIISLTAQFKQSHTTGAKEARAWQATALQPLCAAVLMQASRFIWSKQLLAIGTAALTA